MPPGAYPAVRWDESVVEDLHGQLIADPYRWLEDPDSPETQAFVEAQNKLTAGVLEQCEARGAFKDLFTGVWGGQGACGGVRVGSAGGARELRDGIRWADASLQPPHIARPVQLREVRDALQERGALLLLPQLGPAEPVCGELWCRGHPPCRSRAGTMHSSPSDLFQCSCFRLPLDLQIYTQSSVDGEPRVLLDPNTLSDDGTVALGGQAFSEDGSLYAYMLSSGGSDWKTIHVKRVDQETGESQGGLKYSLE